MSRYRIQVDLWPWHTMFEGRRTGDVLLLPSTEPVSLDLEIADAELLAAEWARAPSAFEQEASRSIKAALREREDQIAQENMAHAEE